MKGQGARYQRGGGGNYYRYKKAKKKFPFGPIVLILVLILSIAVFWKVDAEKPKGEGISTTPGNVSENVEENKGKPQENNNAVENQEFYIVQCGVFKSEENASKIANSLSSIGEAFLVKEGELTRVNLGIYNKGVVDETINKIKERGIDATKVAIKIPISNAGEKELSEIISANLKIFNKASEQGVEAIETANMKKWLEELKAVDDKDKNYENIKELREFSKNLPEKVAKKDIKAYYEYLYNFLKKLNYIK